MRCIPHYPIVLPVKIAIVGEAPGEEEELTGIPFIGKAGHELNAMLSEAGIIRNDCYITNVFLDRPPGNDLSKWCTSKKEVGKGYSAPALMKSKYLRVEHLHERDRLWKELNDLNPNLVIALGNTACWALLDSCGITSLRGVIQKSPHIKAKVLPTYHPAAVLRQWDLRAIAVCDLMKAAKEAEYPEVKSPHFEIYIEPSLDDVLNWETQCAESTYLTLDIETIPGKGQITCVGIGIDGNKALVIPFVEKKEAGSYWKTQEEEVLAWKTIKRICNLPQPKVLQNGLYDMQWLWKLVGIPLRNATYDTMILHHSMQPELPKGLEFLASVYTNFPSWKQMRPRGNQTSKLEE